MARFIARLGMVLLALATVSANLAACGGWQATASARMGVVLKAPVGCLMHRGEDEASDKAAPSQSAADACCASSEQTDATITSQAYAPPAWP